MSSSGAKAALQGFRLQALYILSRILSPSGNQLVFQPEGKEDLDIYLDDKLTESIQIKAHRDPLTVSSLTPQKPRSFFHRASQSSVESDAQIKIVSFGPLGEELAKACGGNEAAQKAVATKLERHNIHPKDSTRLLARLTIEQVFEKELHDEVLSFIKSSLAGGDPEHALQLLLYWIYIASEKRKKLTSEGVIDKINQVGRFLVEKATHELEWFNTIVPFERVESGANLEQLAEEYYQGVSARPSHISANLDIRRMVNLAELNNAFEVSRVVIVSGASGQGKTTLALRYCEDYVPDGWRYRVLAIQDRQQALRIATALASHLRAVDAPLFLYIDVAPRDLDWTELVKSLLDTPNIKILVTIRSEDLARRNIADFELGSPQHVQLDFSETDARDMYHSLQAKVAVNAFPSFDDAWRHFGEEGSLLEFVYFITQTSSLTERLKAQICRLQDEVQRGMRSASEMRFLQVCSAANAFDARVDIVLLAKELDLKTPQRTMELFEQEYLLRFSGDKLYVDGLHPIRSLQLSQILDTPFSPWIDAAKIAFNYIPEPDLEIFLLYSFARYPGDAEELVKSLAGRELATWVGFVGVCKSLLWLGIKNYHQQNSDVIKKAKQYFNQAWILLVNYNIGGVPIEDDLLERFSQLGQSMEEKVELARKLQQEQTDPSQLYAPLRKWLEKIHRFPDLSSDRLEWSGFIEAVFWAIKADAASALLAKLTPESLDWAFAYLPIQTLASLLHATFGVLRGDLGSILKEKQEEALIIFRKKYNIFILNRQESHAHAHFIMTFEELNGEKEGAIFSSGNNIPHDLAIERIALLARLLPQFNAFGSQGHGNPFVCFFGLHDDTTKERVQAWSLRSSRLSEINAIFRSLEEYGDRPTNWNEFARAVVVIRNDVVKMLGRAVSVLKKYYSKEAIKSSVWRQFSEWKAWRPLLPMSAVDLWGYFSETRDDGRDFENDNQDKYEQFHLVRYKWLLNAQKDYFRGIDNFFFQAFQVARIVVKSLKDGKNLSQEHLTESAEKLSLNTNVLRLSNINLHNAWVGLREYQAAFRELLGGLVPIAELNELEQKEAKAFSRAWTVWNEFVNHPEERWGQIDIHAQKKAAQCLESIRKALKNSFLELASEGWQVSIITESVPFESKPALWIAVNVESPFEIFSAYMATLNSMATATRGIEIGSYEYNVITPHWQAILIIPTCNGHSYLKQAWKAGQYALFTRKDFTAPEQAWMHLPIKLGDQALQSIDIPFYVNPAPFPWEWAKKVVGEICLRLGNTIAVIESLPEEVDDIGSAIIARYIEQSGEKISKLVTEMDDIYFAMAERYGRLLNVLPHFSNDIRELLGEIANLVSIPKNDGGSLGVQEMKSWQEKLYLLAVVTDILNHLDDVMCCGEVV